MYQAIEHEVSIEQNTISNADLCEALAEELKTKVQHFAYKKVSGEIREAYGTLNPALIPNLKLTLKVLEELNFRTQSVLTVMNKALQNPALLEQDKDTFEFHLDSLNKIHDKAFGTCETVKTTRPTQEDSQVYYDFEAQGLRNFKKENLVCIF